MWLVKKCVSLLRLKQQFPGWEKKDQIDWCAEMNVIKYLRSWNKNLQMDEYGNLYLINPWTPLLCAHMDTVQREQHADKVNTIHLNNEWIIKWDNIIIWWDDKCWIAIAMEVYERLWNQVSLLFPRQEETGCHGSAYFCQHHSDLLQQCTYCLVLDRKFNNNIISNSNGYCSLEFQNELVRVGNVWWFDYHPEHWLCSDANNIRAYLNCVNLSVWYYEPHSEREYVVADDLKKAFNFVMHIVENLHWEWPIYVEPPRPEPVYQAPKSWWTSSRKPAESNQAGLRDDINWWWKYKPKKDVDEWLSLTKWKKSKNEEVKRTSGFFLIQHDWTFKVKENLILWDAEFEEYVELPKWEYRIESYKDEEDETEDPIYSLI